MIKDDLFDLGRQTLLCIGNSILAAAKQRTAPVDTEPTEDTPEVAIVNEEPTAIIQEAEDKPTPISVIDILRRAFRNKGAMTTAALLDYLERTGDMGELRKRYGDGSRGARLKFQTALYELKQAGEVLRSDGKAATPWTPLKLKSSKSSSKQDRGISTNPLPHKDSSSQNGEEEQNAVV
jgi:hypothetical protein